MHYGTSQTAYLDSELSKSTSIRRMFAYTAVMGEMKRATAWETEQRLKDRFGSTIAICASIIAAVRLARDQNLTRSSPRLALVISESVDLAKAILNRVMR